MEKTIKIRMGQRNEVLPLPPNGQSDFLCAASCFRPRNHWQLWPLQVELQLLDLVTDDTGPAFAYHVARQVTHIRLSIGGQ